MIHAEIGSTGPPSSGWSAARFDGGVEWGSAIGIYGIYGIVSLPLTFTAQPSV